MKGLRLLLFYLNFLHLDFIKFTEYLYIQVYCIGTILSMQISFVGFQPVQTSEHMAVSFVKNIIVHLLLIKIDEAKVCCDNQLPSVKNNS